ncbi:MAG: HPr kinase/phosphorylase, partial [Clostridiales bacterium]|nr:HPr kinase/phosphorylase [Clostridiales bacterium]
MPNTQSILLKTLVKEFNLEILHKGAGYETQQVIQTSINRPGLSLVGFYDYFDNNRLQLMGKMENTYLKMMGREERL